MEDIVVYYYNTLTHFISYYLKNIDMATALTGSLENLNETTDPQQEDDCATRISSPRRTPYNKRSGSLGTSNLVRPNLNPYRPPDFTRIRRLNTFKCVKRPVYHPPLKGKALSLNGIGSRRESENETNVRPLNMTSSNSSGPEVQVQEIIMTFAAQLSSTSSFSTSSEMLSFDETLTSPTMSIPAAYSSSLTERCTICCEDMSSNLPLVIFGDTKLHLKCFSCGKCHSSMGAMKEFLVQVDGTPLCTGCTPACHICHEKIFHDHVSVLKKNFHDECLACSRCKRVS